MEEDMPPDILQTEPPAPPPTKTLMVMRRRLSLISVTDFWHRTDLHTFARMTFHMCAHCSSSRLCDTLSPEEIKHKEHVRVSIQVVRRAYEEGYLREPIGKERPCIMGEQCQGLHLPHVHDNAFILREFLLPTEEDEFKRTGKLPNAGRLCLMCKRSKSHAHSSTSEPMEWASRTT